MMRCTFSQRSAAALLLALLLTGVASAPAQQAGDAVILFDNDVHCRVEGYPYMAGLRDSLARKGCHTALVSAGDYIAGGPYGAASKGGYIIRLMNAAGYDVAAFGNHEFDYGITRLKDLRKSARFDMVCCNLQNVDSHSLFAAPYVLRRMGTHTVAFVGVTTPTTRTSCNPMTFKNVYGRFQYSFHYQDIVQQVQQWVDSARREGADCVVLLAHLGDKEGDPTSVWMASQLTGVNVILDGHEHHVIDGKKLAALDGREVLLASTGSRLDRMGVLVIPPDGSPSVKLIPYFYLYGRQCYSRTVQDTLAKIRREYEADGDYVVAESVAPLIAETSSGKRVVRLQETAIGNLVADAFRLMAGADIGWVNGGAIRANIPQGVITHNTLFAVLPHGNRLCMIEATGQDIINALETGVRSLPEASGAFPQVSGMTYKINTRVKSHVVLGEDGLFQKVKGRYRVYDVKVGGEPIDPARRYTIAGINFVLLDGGDGITFPSAKRLPLNHISDPTDIIILENHMQNLMGGEISGLATMTDGRIEIK